MNQYDMAKGMAQGCIGGGIGQTQALPASESFDQFQKRSFDQFQKRMDAEKAEATAAAHREDPWRHRSQRMRCASCMWFVAKRGEEGLKSRAGKPDLGRCRRHAPMPGGHGWPAVFESDWCGDHKLDERAP